MQLFKSSNISDTIYLFEHILKLHYTTLRKDNQGYLNMPIIEHPFPPVFNSDSRVLILGSFPSVKSRADGFFYGNPKNRFWKIISKITNNPLPTNIPEKKTLLLNNHIALWDVIKSCDIEASKDNSIKNVIPNDLTDVLNNSNIGVIFANGNTAYNLYVKYSKDLHNMNIIKLPSTSPANASFNFEKLFEIWNKSLKCYLN